MQTTEQELLSQLRKSLTDRVQELKGLLPTLLGRQLMVKGSVYQLRRKCGKPTCHCADGRGHESMVLSWSEAGRTRLRSIPEQNVNRLRRLTERYQRFRKARARLVQISREILKITNRIEEVRRSEP